MSSFIADFNSTPFKQGKKWHRPWKTYEVDAADYREAYVKAVPVLDWLYENEPEANPWRLYRLASKENVVLPAQVEPLPDGSAYTKLYYFPRHLFEHMEVEGTRIMDLPDEGANGGHGALIRDVDTGAMSYAGPNGKFYTNIPEDRIQSLSEIFVWHPVIFPIVDGQVIWWHYTQTSILLSVPMRFNGHDAYDKQVLWMQGINGAEMRRKL